MSRIGIMGGTFNPIHIGHLIAANEVQEKFCLDKVLFIPSGIPPHKPDSEVIDPEHRFEMVRLAVASNSIFEASRIEIDREGNTYTINTLIELKEMYDRETSFYFIIGADVVPELTTWKEFKKVFQLCEFIAVMRPGSTENSFFDGIRQLNEKWGAKIHPVQSRLIDVSSTEIRQRIMDGASVKYLVPDAVESYISEKGLYR
jgi:nicotinate-nucleotide adenylyltransferase